MKRFLLYMFIACCIALVLTSCKKDNDRGKSPEPASVSTTATTRTNAITQKTASAASTTSTTVTEEPTEPPVKYYTAAAVYAANGDTPIFADNVHESISPASMTKLMTACVALKYMKPDDIVTVGSELGYVQPYSSMCNILPNQKFTMYDLLTGLLLSSGNDAAYTIAVNTARKAAANSAMTDSEAIEYFCGLMNQLAAELEMTNTHFSTPDGWDHHQQLTTIHDLMKLAKYAVEIKEISEITSIPKKTVTAVTGESFDWVNSNRLLHEEDDYYCPYAIGTKTGSTVNAGNCLISQFYINATNYIIIVAGCPTDESRFEATLELFNEYCMKENN
ncbi:MAG: D-alanyl-D-alanine carboxypeptidase [Ruminococcus sp.]|nr:D-alanyl-D-alanine carboxypeptidase [Ruminococcus sp.]